MSTEQSPLIQPPSLWLSLSDMPRAMLEMGSIAFLHKSLLEAPQGDGHAVMVIPGYGAGDLPMAVLRYYLNQWNYDARPWGLGVNFTRNRITAIDQVNAFRADMEKKVADQIRTVCDATGGKVSLVGWSLGGIYANTMAQDYPELVRHVITLGAPYGDPRGTAAWNVLKRLNFSKVADEAQDFDTWLKHDNDKPRSVPTTVIYSPTDGIVSPEVAMLMAQENIENVAVNSSHTGFAFNPHVYRIIAETLAASKK